MFFGFHTKCPVISFFSDIHFPMLIKSLITNKMMFDWTALIISCLVHHHYHLSLSLNKEMEFSKAVLDSYYIKISKKYIL